jgi:hypothetical protein
MDLRTGARVACTVDNAKARGANGMNARGTNGREKCASEVRGR